MNADAKAGPEVALDPAPTAKVPWAEVALFFVIATGVSAPFRLGLIDPAALLPLPPELEIFYRVLRGVGPAVAYWVIRRLLGTRVPQTTTFFGREPGTSLIALAVVPIGLTAIGVTNSVGLSDSQYGALTGAMLACYAVGEEYGWRGYLQQALAPIALWKRVVLIASLWYLWHLNFLVPGISVASHLIHFGGLLLGSWGLLKVSEVSGSILFAAAVHLAFNIVFDVSAPMDRKLAVLAAAVAIWALLLRGLARRSRSVPQ